MEVCARGVWKCKSNHSKVASQLETNARGTLCVSLISQILYISQIPTRSECYICNRKRSHTPYFINTESGVPVMGAGTQTSEQRPGGGPRGGPRAGEPSAPWGTEAAPASSLPAFQRPGGDPLCPSSG